MTDAEKLREVAAALDGRVTFEWAQGWAEDLRRIAAKLEPEPWLDMPEPGWEYAEMKHDNGYKEIVMTIYDRENEEVYFHRFADSNAYTTDDFPNAKFRRARVW